MSKTQAAPLRAVPGSFFQRGDGQIWRLDAIDGTRWTICSLTGVGFSTPRSVPSNFSCELLAIESVHTQVINLLYEKGLATERGSKDSSTHGNDFTGAYWTDPSVITHKKRFRRRLVVTRSWIVQLLNIWGVELVTKFFIGLETLGGYYDAHAKEFTHPSDAPSGHGLAAGYFDLDGDSGRNKPPAHEVERRHVRGTVPDLNSYHDTSDHAKILPHLRAIKDLAALARIAKKAVHPAVRKAAHQVHREKDKTQLKLL